MCVDCGSCVAKFLLYTFNFIFFTLGTVVLGVGIWLVADKASFMIIYRTLVHNEQFEIYNQPAVIEQLGYALIICGGLMFFFSFLGYCGAIRESQCMLTTYAVFLILILIAQITIGGLAAAFKDKTRTETKTFLQTTFTRYYATGNRTDGVTLMWNHLMVDLSCCGVNDYNDFKEADKWWEQREDNVMPKACCKWYDVEGVPKVRDENCTVTPTDSNSYYRKGCFDAIMEWIISKRNILIIVTIVIVIIELLLIFLSFCLCKSIDKYQVIRL